MDGVGTDDEGGFFGGSFGREIFDKLVGGSLGGVGFFKCFGGGLDECVFAGRGVCFGGVELLFGSGLRFRRFFGIGFGGCEFL